jgi:3-oxoacyl-(acyl-carrier-protein) synthase
LSTADSDTRRIVVTGMAINTPLGDTLDAFREGLLGGRSAITRWKFFDTAKVYSKVGGDLSGYDVKARVAALESILPADTWERLRRLTIKAPFSTRLSMLLAADAFRDAGLFGSALDRARTAAVVAGHNVNENYVFENRRVFEEEPDWIDPFLSLSRLDTDHAGCVSELLGLRGPIYTVGAACASGNAALRLACDEIRHRGNAAALVVGAVLDYNPLELHAMALMGAIAFKAFNDEPARASRPFDKRREGFVPSHGGGCLVLESLAHARARGARIYAEVLAADASADANHLPNPSAEGQIALMTRVLEQARLAPEQIDYVNAHATSTPLGDLVEAQSIRTVFGAHSRRLKVNAPKSMLGHCCWSAPTVEAIAGILQMRAGRLHPSINIDEFDETVDLDVCAGAACDWDIRYFMKNSFGFGGINCVSIFGRYEAAA